MQRSDRMKRLARLAEAGERAARRELLDARSTRDSTGELLADVYEQCRRLAENEDQLSVVLGRALIESGWATLEAHRQDLERAEAAVEAAEHVWRADRTRLDALVRLIERLDEAEAEEAEQKVAAEFNDIVSARWHRPSGTTNQTTEREEVGV